MSTPPRRRRHEYRFLPLTPDLWSDFERLFGARGACGGCWCMWWRLKRSDYERLKGEDNRRAMREIVRQGPPPGLLAFSGEGPVGWCAVGPRDDYPVLGRSRNLKPIDDAPVWSVVCFFIRRDHRRRGLSVALLEAAARYAAGRGAERLEGYPVEPKTAAGMPDVFAHTGLAAAFRASGFRECARRSPTRPIFRRTLGGDGSVSRP